MCNDDYYENSSVQLQLWWLKWLILQAINKWSPSVLRWEKIKDHQHHITHLRGHLSFLKTQPPRPHPYCRVFSMVVRIIRLLNLKPLLNSGTLVRTSVRWNDPFHFSTDSIKSVFPFHVFALKQCKLLLVKIWPVNPTIHHPNKIFRVSSPDTSRCKDSLKSWWLFTVDIWQ